MSKQRGGIVTATAWLLALAAAGAYAAESPPAAADGFLIRDGDRVVIYGDSITVGVAHQGWSRYVETYVRTRHPDWTTRIWNRARSGDKASNLDRFKRDCVPLAPDVILFNMGMNDAEYKPAIAPGVRIYIDSIRTAVGLARQAKPEVRFALISPILYENRACGALPFYPYVLRSYALEERGLALRLGLPFIDLNLAYGQTLGLADAVFPGTLCFSGDGIHPATSGGHLFIAAHILKGLGASGDLATVEIDAKELKVTALQGARVEQLQNPDGTLQFERTLAALPFPVVAATDGIPYRDRAVAFLVDIADSLNRDWLKIAGLPAKAYALTIDDRPVAEFATEELADGVNLSRFFQTPDQEQAVAVSEAVGRKQILEAKAWQLGLSPKTEEAMQKKAEEEAEGARVAVGAVVRPTRHRFRLAPLDREVDRYRAREQAIDIAGPKSLVVGDDGSVRQDIKISVGNPTTSPRRVEFFWSGAGALPATVVAELATGERKDFAFALTLSPADPVPRLRVSHQPVDLSFPPLIQEYAPLRLPRYDVPRAAAAVKVDGDLVDWPATPAIDFEGCFAPAVLQRRIGPGDCSAKARVLWTEAGLFVAVAVQDQDHVSHFTDDRCGWDDMVGVSAGRANCTLALTTKGAQILPTPVAAKGVLFAVARHDLETDYELFIPWSQITDRKPEAGITIPLNIMIGDRDRDESHKEVYWAGTPDKPQPGTIRLEAEGAAR